jgi:hypothetical protein
VPPVDHEPRSLQLAAEVLDVPRNEIGGVDPDLQRVVLRVDAEGVEANGLEHRVPLETLESSIDVVSGEREEVADVQSLRRRIREHHQGVERPGAGGEVGVVASAGLPAGLPLPLDGVRVVAVRLGGGIVSSLRHFGHGGSTRHAEGWSGGRR